MSMRSKSDHAYNFWPSESQLLLLKSALLPPQEAKTFWKKYCAQNDLKNVEYIDSTFFPMVYHNLHGLYQDDSLPVEMQICKSKYRHNWTKNQLLLKKLKEIVTILNAKGFDICLIKGVAMIAAYYENPALRNLGDIDLLVLKFDDFKKSYASLLNNNWMPDFNVSFEAYIKTMHGVLLKDKDHIFLDLHCALFFESVWDIKLRNIKIDPLEINFLGCPLKILRSELMVLHAIHHGLQYSPAPLLRWILDVVTVLNKTPCFDWAYFFELARAIEAMYVVSLGLLYLVDQGFIQIEPDVQLILRNYQPMIQEKKRFELFAKPHEGWAHTFYFWWNLHTRQHSILPGWKRMLLFPLFVKTKLRFESWLLFGFTLLYKLPKQMLRPLWRRIIA